MEPARAASTWPTLQDYDEALQNRVKTIYDRDIKTGELSRDATGIIRLNGGGGKYVCVYKVSSWAIRCFMGYPPSDIEERYEAINAYLQQYRAELPFLVDHQWIKRGVQIRGKDWPLIKVRFLSDCMQLGEFLAQYHDNAPVVEALADSWFNLMKGLEARQIAHGDLDVTNVLVRGTSAHSLSLHLIDFDGMYVPTLQGRSLDVADLGHEHFQPVKQGVRHFNAGMDRFSALVIYLSLIGLAGKPDLWDACEADESNRLLLGSDDFQRPALSQNVVRLHQQQGNLRLQTCLRELIRSIEQARMPKGLVEILGDVPSRRVLTPIGTVTGLTTPMALPLPIPIGPNEPPLPTPNTIEVKPQSKEPVPISSSVPATTSGAGRTIGILVAIVVIVLIIIGLLHAAHVVLVPAHAMPLAILTNVGSVFYD